MTNAAKNNLMDTYRRKKTLGKLSSNLANPSPGKLKAECMIVYEEREEPDDDETLRIFFEKPGTNGYRKTIESADIDMFRPLCNLINGKTGNPQDKTYKMLAWLMGDTTEVVVPEADRYATIKMTVTALVVLVLIGGLSFIYLEMNTGCMYWTGDHYQRSACEVDHGDTTVIAYNAQRALHLKKINRPDTITYRSVGRVWYFKVNKNVEYYTAGGYYPPDPKRRLKPLTRYMIDKYVVSK